MQAEVSPLLLVQVASGLRLLLESLSVLTVLLGLLACLRRSGWRARPGELPALAAVRLRFGSWLSLALEFQLGADIVATTITPGRENLIRLAAVALIRTFLNVFLAREQEAEQRLSQARPLREPPP